MKEEQLIDAVLVKTPERIETLSMSMNAGIQDLARNKNIGALIPIEKRKLYEPTEKSLLEQLKDTRLIVMPGRGDDTLFVRQYR